MDRPSVKIAYLIMIHRHLELFQRLFRQIYEPSDYYLVHVDRKSRPEYHRAVAEFLHDFPAAQLMESMKIGWGAWSMVELHLRATERLLQTAADWSYLINLSGQDFPLQTNAEIHATLATGRDRNFIDIHDLAEFWPAGLKRVRYYWVVVPGLPIRRPVRLPIRRRFLAGAKPYNGSNWFILSRAFSQWLVTSPEVERFKRFYRHTVCADEGFVHTVLMHSPFKDSVVNENYRAIRWTGRSSPHTWTCQDLDYLLSSGKMFARKFDPDVDPRVIDLLEEHLVRRKSCAPAAASAP